MNQLSTFSLCLHTVNHRCVCGGGGAGYTSETAEEKKKTCFCKKEGKSCSLANPSTDERKSSRKVDIAKINNKRKFNGKTIFGSGGSPEGKSRVQNWAPAFSEVSRCWVLKPAHVEGPCRHGNSSWRCWNYPGTKRQVYSQKCSGYRRGRRCALRFCYLLMRVGGLGLPSLRLGAGNFSTSTAQAKGVDLLSSRNSEGKHSFSGQIPYFPFLLTNLWQILCGLWELAPGLLYGSLQMYLE